MHYVREYLWLPMCLSVGIICRYTMHNSININTMSIRKKIFAAIILAAGSVLPAVSQIAVKTNLFYDATTTPNIGVEVGLKGKSTVILVYGRIIWTFHSDSGDRKVKHWVLMPEYRRYLCQRFSGHFFGVHMMGGQFNAANVTLPIPGGFFGGENLRAGVRDHRYQGGFAGGGITYGYQWILGRHVNLEAEVGVGYNRVWYDKYACGDCGAKIGHGQSNYAGITKLGISIMYLF